MAPHEVEAFRAHPMAVDAARLRRWDDAAKDPNGPVLDIGDVLAAYDRLAPVGGVVADA